MGAPNRSRLSLAGLVLVGFALLLGPAAAGADAAEAPSSCTSSSLYVVAHEDDTLLFQSPAVLQDIQSGRCVRTVFLTAGDAGKAQSYWEDREEGAEAAYAQMAMASDHWAASTIVADGHPIRLETLVGQPRVSLVFMRLPDGNVDGKGFERYGFQSLLKLWDSTEPGTSRPSESSITAVDGSTTYGSQDLVETLASLINSFEPQLIATQNFSEEFFEGDHPDHIAAAYYTWVADKSYTAPHRLLGYQDYDTTDRPTNLSGELLGAKSFAFYTYGSYDSGACAEEVACFETPYAEWLERQYVVGNETVGVVANAGYTQAVSPGGAVTLDGSQSSDQGRIPLGYEWVQTAGPSVVLSGADTATPSFAMPSQAGSLTFSLVVRAGLTDSSPDTVTVTAAGGVDPAPTAKADGPAQNVASGSTVSLDGSSSSDPKGLPLEYAWTQVAGPEVNLSATSSAKPSFVAPPGPVSLQFSLVVSNGSETSAPSTITVGVEPANSGEANVALLATATASSQATGQTAAKAIDGVISGYPANSSAEWATESGRAGSTLTLKWSKAYVVNHVVLYDRPNSDDQITAGKLTFSDNSSVSFGALPNSGSPGTVVSFPAHLTTSLKMTVSTVSATTRNVGLAEIQAWGIPGTSPALASASSATFTTGTAGSFAVTSTANPTATLSESGTLPSGVKFVANGDGTATLSGTPAASSAPAGSSKAYPITLKATNGVGIASQSFALTVVNNEPKNSPPTFTTPSSRSGNVGKALSIPIEATGTPLPTLSLSGSAPKGLTFKATSAGVATLSGTPTTAGTTHLTVTAKNTAGTVTQALTVVIER